MIKRFMLGFLIIFMISCSNWNTDTVKILSTRYGDTVIAANLLKIMLDEKNIKSSITEIDFGREQSWALFTSKVNKFDIIPYYSTSIKETITNIDSNKDDLQYQHGLNIVRGWLDLQGYIFTEPFVNSKWSIYIPKGGRAEQLGVKTISQLYNKSNGLIIGGPDEFMSAKGYSSWNTVKEAYGISAFSEIETASLSSLYPLARSGKVDAVIGGTEAPMDFNMLVDDKSVLVPFPLGFLMSKKFAEKHPEIVVMCNLFPKYFEDSNDLDGIGIYTMRYLIEIHYTDNTIGNTKLKNFIKEKNENKLYH